MKTKKIIGIVAAFVLVVTQVLPSFTLKEIPVAAAAACTISANQDMTSTYVNACDGITVDTSSTLTFYGEDLNMNGTASLTINEGVTVTWSGTGVFTDANDSIVINGAVTHVASGSGVILSASGNVTVGSSGSINVDEKGCGGGVDSYESGHGPNSDNVCADATAGYGIGDNNGGAGAGHGGAGGRGNTANKGGATYGSSTTPTLLGSGGAAGQNSDGGDGGGKIYLDVSGELAVGGSISAAGGNGVGVSSYSGGGGSGGSIYISTGTLSGAGTISASGGDGGASYTDGGGGAGGRVAVYYDTSTFSDLANITATKGVKGGTDGGAVDGGDGTTFILDQTNDNLRIVSGLDFEDGVDYTRANITIDSGAEIYCDAQTTLNIGVSGNYTDNGSTWTCSNAVTTVNLSATGTIATTGIDWNLTNVTNFNLSAATWTTSGTNTIDNTKAGALTDWNVTNNLTLNNLTWTGPANAGTASALGATITFDNGTDVVLTNTDILASIDWDLANLTLDFESSLNSNGRGCVGGTGSYEDGDGPDASTGVCATSNTGYGIGDNNGGGGGGHGGAGGRGSDPSTGGATYGSSIAPTLFGSGGAAGQNQDAGDGGGKTILDITDTLTLNGSISVDGADGTGASSYSGGGGSGGSVYITTVTFAGTGSISAAGGNGGASYTDGGGGAGGRVAVYYDTSTFSDLANITATKGLEGGTDGAAEDGGDGTTFILDQTNDNLRIVSGLDFEDGVDYTRANITIDSGAEIYCDAQTTLNIGVSGNYTDNGSMSNQFRNVLCFTK